MSKATGEYLNRVLPNSTLTVYPDQGHLLLFGHWDDVLLQLVEQVR